MDIKTAFIIPAICQRQCNQLLGHQNDLLYVEREVKLLLAHSLARLLATRLSIVCS